LAGERPINADVPASPEAGEPEQPTAKPAPELRPPKPRRKPIPMALKAIAGLFVLAFVFIVAAILGGGSGGSGSKDAAPAPVARSGDGAESTPSQPASELGYPSFATANTTRVGGPDPASNAAAVALAVYPSASPAQQPEAVSLVDAGDWQTAVAAAVLMAPPLGAPVLVSEADGMPEATVEALGALDPQGGKGSAGAQVFAIAGAAAPADMKTTAVGSSGAAGAAAIAALRDRLFGAPPKHVVVASGSESAFAMPAAAWAARSGDPVLFSGGGKLPAATAAALKRYRRLPVYVLGPSSAISSGVFREIAQIDGRVRRVSNEDPVANAIELARYSSGGFGWNLNDPGHGFVVARSEQPLDAAAAAALSATGAWGPLLLSDSADRLPDALRGYLLDVKPGYTTNPTRAFYNHVWVIGDEDAIDLSQQAEIDELAALAKIAGNE
jgi:Cell wall binding domain 2 (CWB2)